MLPPVIAKFNNDSSPVMSIALSGNRSLRELTEYGDKVVKVQLERSTGVGQVNIVGGLSRAINIWIDPDRDMFAILLGNRVHPVTEQPAKGKMLKISRFRPIFHDAVVRACGIA